MKQLFKKIVLILLSIIFLFPTTLLAAPDSGTQPQLDASTQQQLEDELKTVEAQIAQLETQLTQTKGEKKTLAAQIQRLKNEQSRLRLQIKENQLRLAGLQKNLDTTAQAIAKNVLKMEGLKAELSSFLITLNQKDSELFISKLASGQGLGSIFVEAKNYEQLSAAIADLAHETAGVRQELQMQQTTYETQRDDTRQVLSMTILQQSELNGKISEQNDLLKETQGREKTYQSMLADSQKRAAEIKNRIYNLLGVSTQINFGEAVAVAQWVSKQTGVPPAFLLAILTQESNLGQNVGTCNRPGDPPEKSWKVIMKPDRDQEPFVNITGELGRDPDVTPVSCPMKDRKGKQIGWGGAMGPAQFIPSTWVRHEADIASLTGKSAPNPWDVRDAFVAAALLLKANGADATSDGQWAAAMRYFSGSTNTRYRFYGDNVLALTQKYEQDIKDLTPSG